MSEDGRVVHIKSGVTIASPGQPDEKVVKDAEMILEMARAGEITGFAFALQHSDGSTGNRFVGVISRSLVGGLFALMARISGQIDES